MKKHDLRKQSKLLVESILEKDPICANSIFQRLILEAEAEREDEVLNELDLFDDVDSPASATDETDDMNETDAESDVETEDDIESMDNSEIDNVVDDIVEINCQINAKLISNLFDKITELKANLAGLGLDETSIEYLEYSVPIEYYADKLQDFQNQTNPGIDQDKLKTAIEKINNAIEDLFKKINGGDDTSFDVDSPEEIEASAGLTDETDDESEEAETDDVEDDTESEDDMVDAESENETDEENSDDDLEELFS